MKLDLNEKKDLLITNEVNGNVFAVVTKGDNQENRIRTAIQEEFAEEILDFHEIVKDSDTHITFWVTFENGDEQSIELLRAFIY